MTKHGLTITFVILASLACNMATTLPTDTSAISVVQPTATAEGSSCPDILHGKAKVGDVYTKTGDAPWVVLEIYASPPNTEKIINLYIRTFTSNIEIIGGPICIRDTNQSESLVFWEVHIPLLDTDGWIDDSWIANETLTLLTAPASDELFTDATNYVSDFACASDIPTFLKTGDKAQFTGFDDYGGVAAYDRPDFEYIEDLKYYFGLPNMTEFEVVNGPVCIEELDSDGNKIIIPYWEVILPDFNNVHVWVRDTSAIEPK